MTNHRDIPGRKAGPVTLAIAAMRNTASASPFHGLADTIDWLRELPAKAPDADLLALGAQLDEAMAAYLAFAPTFDAAERGCDAAIEAAKPDLARMTGKPLEALIEKIEAPFRAEIEHGGALQEAVDRRCDAIIEGPKPQTLAGLAALARCGTAYYQPKWDKPLTDLDWDVRLILELANAILRLAGLDRLGRPVTGGSV